MQLSQRYNQVVLSRVSKSMLVRPAYFCPEVRLGSLLKTKGKKV
ncbi:hypothetical protein D041_0835 [Vibrio parahaemolyticus EKP-008]|nr:hypothetical protein D041_0835 [Vibrio parahaemolyticus EKP-008]